MPAIRSQHSRVFEDFLQKKRIELLNSLASGHPLEMYWRLCGQIQGLDLALRINEDTDYTLNGEVSDGGA